MSNFGTTETGIAVPVQYTWGHGYNINGLATSGHLEEEVLPSLNQLPWGSLVADFGSGNGRLLRRAPHFTDRPYVFRAYEINPDAVRAYNAKVDSLNGSRGLIFPDKAEVANLTDLRLGEDRFRAALLWRVLHSIPVDHHETVLRQIAQTLRPGALLHVAALSDRDWKRDDLGENYKPGEMNNCYTVMETALQGQPDVTDWNLYFFRPGELAELGQRAGLGVVYEHPITESSGFEVLRQTRPPIEYDYVEFYKPA